MNKADGVDDANIDSLWCALGCFEDKTVLLSCICIKGRDLHLKCRWYKLMEIAARKENNRPVMIEALSNLYLMEYLQQVDYWVTIMQYEPYLLPQHQSALTNRYIHLAWEKMDKNERNRSAYQQIRAVLQQAVNIGGKEEVTQAITDMKAQFKRYRALVDELGMIG